MADEKTLKTYEISANDNLFTGVWNLDQANLTKYDPYISGYAFIVWTKLPAFMNNVTDKDVISGMPIDRAFKQMTEKNFKSLSGIGDITLGVEDVTHGFAGNAYGVATGISKENTSFSITHQELAGSPIRKLYEYWVTGVRDPETGLATYHGKIGSNECPTYSAKYHTGELLYIVTDPTGGEHGIEFACYYTNVMPTKIPQDHLNFTNGDHAVAEASIDFRGNYHTSDQINQLAKAYLKQKLTQKTFADYKAFGDVKRDEGYYDPKFEVTAAKNAVSDALDKIF